MTRLHYEPDTRVSLAADRAMEVIHEEIGDILDERDGFIVVLIQNKEIVPGNDEPPYALDEEHSVVSASSVRDDAHPDLPRVMRALLDAMAEVSKAMGHAPRFNGGK